MRNETRIRYEEYCSRIATLNGVGSATKKFSVAEPIEQAMESRIQESASFLSLVNSVGTRELKGQALGLYATGPVSGRTNTATNDRETRDPTGLIDNSWEVAPHEANTHITYDKLDLWAGFPDFQTRIRDIIVQQLALDRIMVGFNGVTVAAATDLETYPLLQDVNIGWLQKLRTHYPQNWLSDGSHTADPTKKEVRVGQRAAGTDDHDYLSLEGLIVDAKNSLIAPWYQEDPNLVVLLGRDLIADRDLSLIDRQTLPTEQLAAETRLINRTMGGLRAYTAPFFPPRSLAVLPLPKADANGKTKGSILSIYWQRGSSRRYIQENPKRNRIEDYSSIRLAYVVEDYQAMALVDNITFPGEGTFVAPPGP